MEKICYVIWKFKSPKNFVNMGGSETQLLKWIKQLEKQDKKITIITRKTENDEKFESSSENIEIYRINTTKVKYLSMLLFTIGLFFMFIKLIRKEKFDIIHVPLPDVYLSVIYLIRLIFKIPVITTAAGDELFPQIKKGLWYVDRVIVKYLMLKSDGLHTLNNITYELGEVLNYKKNKLFLISNGVEIPIKSKNYEKLTNKIVYIGAMRHFPEKQKREIKNLEFLLESFDQLRKNKPNLRLLMVGDGNYRIKLEEKTKKLNLQNHVIFTGYQTDIVKYHMEADIFVNASLKEGMPNTVIEAMGSGIFVLCSNIHAHRHIIKNGITGVLFDNTNRNDFIRKVNEFYNNPENYIEIAKNGRRYIEDYFAIEVIVNQILVMYKKVLYYFINDNYY